MPQQAVEKHQSHNVEDPPAARIPAKSAQHCVVCLVDPIEAIVSNAEINTWQCAVIVEKLQQQIPIKSADLRVWQLVSRV